jgi:ATP phosphoribosyltransferase regulatory subunit
MTDNSGRLLVLRPDNTTPIARVVATKLNNFSKNDYHKIYYNQNVFRINTDYSGKKSEIIQSGVELIGLNGIKTDIYFIETALKILKSTGLNFKLEIGHVGFYKSIIDSMNFNEDEKEIIRLYIESKNTGELNSLRGLGLDNKDSEEYEKYKSIYKAIRMIPQLFGGYEVIEKARDLAENNRKAQDVLDYLYRLYTILDKSGYGEHIIIDLGIVHEIDYYTGLVISGYVDKIGENILVGGRYDNLIANFGVDLPAVGFAVNVNLIAKALEDSQPVRNQSEIAAISEIVHYNPEDYDKALKYINAKKISDTNTNIKIELSCFESIEETEEYAAKNGIKAVIL